MYTYKSRGICILVYVYTRVHTHTHMCLHIYTHLYIIMKRKENRTPCVQAQVRFVKSLKHIQSNTFIPLY